MSSIISVNSNSMWIKRFYALPILSGLLLGLSVPGIGVWGLAWVGLVPALYALLSCQSWRRAILEGLILGSVYYGILFWWFWSLYPLTWMGFSDLGSHFLIALAWALVTGIQASIVGIIWMCLYAAYKKLGFFGLLLAPVFWVSGLWFLNQQPLGVPWGFLTYTQAQEAFCRNAVSHLTFWGFEAFIILVNVLITLGYCQLSILVTSKPSLRGGIATGNTDVAICPTSTNQDSHCPDGALK